MHLFTLAQIICVGILWGVKSSPGSLAFPFVLILIIPVNKFLFRYIFTEQELLEVSIFLLIEQEGAA